MQFIAITVENIFAYCGKSRIDLTECTPEQNIIIVRGRNGAGKTSLLNAIKLLFLGSSDEKLRRVGFGGTALSKKHYVLGQPGRWSGVFNSVARRSAPSAYVSLEWMAHDRQFKARRLFRLKSSGTDFDEELTVTVDGTPLDSMLAQATLQQILPKEAVPFFFFDGEQIQSLADAEIGREQAEIERLLGLSFFVLLLRQVDAHMKEKARSGMPDDVKLRLVNAGNLEREAQARAEAAGRSRVALEEEILDLERTMRRLDDDRNRLRSGAITEADRQRMENRIAVLVYQREQLAEQIAEALPPEVLMLTHPRLVRTAYQLLNERISGAADATLAERLHRALPDRLTERLGMLSPPVTLTDPQAVDFRSSVQEVLEQLGVPLRSDGSPLLASLSPRQVSMLRDQFLVWSEKGPMIFTAHADLLRQMRHLANEERQARRELDEAELTSDAAKARFESLTEDIENQKKELRDRIERAADQKVEEQRALKRAADQAKIISALEEEHKDVVRENKGYQMAMRVKRALENYREEQRLKIKNSVQKRLNDRIEVLLGPSELIKSVSLDNQFVMTYYDERNAEVARHSISAGMRQLLAMAMLWALKDEAQRPLPVVIDTPLGRIDRANRNLLMQEYFPNAGNPLVLLPTDSEFGEDGYAQIGYRIKRRYNITNSGGESARIVDEEPAGTRYGGGQ